MAVTRRSASTCPCGSTASWETLAPVKSIAELFGQPATQAPQPMHSAASMAYSASGLRNQNGITVGNPAGVAGGIAAGLDDRVEGTAINDQVLDDREGTGSPRLDEDAIAVLEGAHVQLADGGTILAAMRHAVDHLRAHTADTFAAVVIEGDRVLAFLDQLFVDIVEHLQEGLVGADMICLVGLQFSRSVRPFLAPYVQCMSDSLFVTPYGKMDILEFQRLLVQFGLLACTLELPGRRIAEVLVVTLGFAVIVLVLDAEVTAAGLFAVQGILGQQFAELEEVGQTAGILQLLVELLADHR